MEMVEQLVITKIMLHRKIVQKVWNEITKCNETSESYYSVAGKKAVIVNQYQINHFPCSQLRPAFWNFLGNIQ